MQIKYPLHLRFQEHVILSVNDNGVLTAYTTDGIGFMRAVKEDGVDIIGKKMTLLGAGGAATAILVQAALEWSC
mgnify:CR=1 FL=1